MSEVLSACRRCRRQWPRPCCCEDGGQPRPLHHLLRPADPAVRVRAEFTYRGNLYGAAAWFAECDYGQWAPTPGAVEIWRSIGTGTRTLVEAPSFMLMNHALSPLRIALDVEMRRCNPNALEEALKRQVRR